MLSKKKKRSQVEGDLQAVTASMHRAGELAHTAGREDGKIGRDNGMIGIFVLLTIF